LRPLLGDVEERLGDLEERRDRLKEMLSRDDLEDPDYPPQAFKLAEKHLGDLLKDVSPSVLQQEKRLWATIESLDWPASYVEDLMNVQESFLRHYAERSDEYREMIALSERIVALDGLPEDSPEIEQLVEDYVHHARSSSLP
jgi:hypothetical protein